MTSDAEYNRARAIEERALAAAAIDPTISAIHRVLAEKYEALAREVEVQPTVGLAWD